MCCAPYFRKNIYKVFGPKERNQDGKRTQRHVICGVVKKLKTGEDSLKTVFHTFKALPCGKGIKLIFLCFREPIQVQRILVATIRIQILLQQRKVLSNNITSKQNKLPLGLVYSLLVKIIKESLDKNLLRKFQRGFCNRCKIDFSISGHF